MRSIELRKIISYKGILLSALFCSMMLTLENYSIGNWDQFQHLSDGMCLVSDHSSFLANSFFIGNPARIIRTM